MVKDNAMDVIDETLENNGFVFQKDILNLNNEVVCQVWRNRKGKDFLIYANELDLEYDVVIKEDIEEKGFIVDVLLFNNIIKTKVYYYDDLEDEYRDYLNETSNNEKSDITKIMSWDEWLFSHKDYIKERTKEDLMEGDLHGN